MKAFFAWIKQWARTAVETVTDVRFYRRAGARKTGEAAGHLAMLAVLWTLPLTVLFFVGLRQVSNGVAAGLRHDIPPGTTFEMKDGKLSNNLAEPLVFRERGATIIVNTATSTLDLEEGEDGLMIGSDAMVSQDDGLRESLDFKDAPDFKVDREGLMDTIARWAPLALFGASIFVLIFMFLAFWGGMLLNALLHGFALWLLLKVIKRERPWREAFVVAAYAATASVLLRLLLQGAGPLEAVPGIVYWGYIAWIAYDAYKTGTPPAHKEGESHERKEAAADRPDPKGESGTV